APPALVAGGEGAPLSSAERRLLFQAAADGPSPLYNVPVALELSGRLDADALDAAVGDVVARHEALRTVYVGLDADPAPRVLDPAEAPVTLLRREVGDDAVDAAVAAAARHCFDLGAEAPLRAELLAAGPDRHVLVLVAHHIAVDEWSLAQLMADLAGAYRARCRGRAPGWAPPPVRYRDYARWQRAALGDHDDPASPAAAQLAYWRATLAGAPAEHGLPTDRPRPPVASHRGATVSFRVPPEVYAPLAAVARREGASMLMVFHAALAALLARLGGGDDVVVATPVAGRADQALDEVVGFFVNTVVLRTDVSGDPSFAELVARVRAGDLAAFDHQDVPFEAVVEALNPPRSPARHPLFQVMVAHGYAGDEAPWEALEVRRRPVGTATAKFDLAFSFVEEADGSATGGEIEYATELFDAAGVERLARRLVRLLEQVAADPDLGVGAVEVLSPAERHQVVEAWNDTAVAVERAPLGELFERQVRRCPEAVAVVDGGVSLTYADLDARANRLARALVSAGARPEASVGVAM
ncbi:MAG: condensation domain-containing protein, partial [Acidimicrobiales bacterium]